MGRYLDSSSANIQTSERSKSPCRSPGSPLRRRLAALANSGGHGQGLRESAELATSTPRTSLGSNAGQEGFAQRRADSASPVLHPINVIVDV